MENRLMREDVGKCVWEGYGMSDISRTENEAYTKRSQNK
jgi:hypothetical protein